MPTEEDVRAAFRGLAIQAPDTDAVLATLRRREGSRRPGWPRFAAAIAAAAAVCLVVGLSVAISGGGQTRHPAGASLLDRVPRYYMVLLAKGSSAPSEAVIRDTVTGKVLATVRPPSPFTKFGPSAAAPNDRTFVLAAQGDGVGLVPARLYRAQFNPARRSIQLTPLPIAEFPAKLSVSALAVSPHGTELAVALSIRTPGRVPREQIRIYSLAGHKVSGPVKLWSATGFVGAMSWASTGVLGFNQLVPGQGVRLLNTDARSGNLALDSRLALKTQAALDRFPAPGSWLLLSGTLASDGTRLAAVAYRYPKTKIVKGKPVEIPLPGSPKIEEFSAATGKLVRVLLPRRPSGRGLFGIDYIAWTNSSGSVVVGVIESTVGKDQAVQVVVGSVSDHTFKTISVLRNAEGEIFPGVPGVVF